MDWHWILIVAGVFLIGHALWDLYPHKPKPKRKRVESRKKRPMDTSYRVPYRHPDSNRAEPRDGEGGHTQTFERLTRPEPPEMPDPIRFVNTYERFSTEDIMPSEATVSPPMWFFGRSIEDDPPPTWPLNLADGATLQWLNTHQYGYLTFDRGLVDKLTWDDLVAKLRAMSPSRARLQRLATERQPVIYPPLPPEPPSNFGSWR